MLFAKACISSFFETQGIVFLYCFGSNKEIEDKSIMMAHIHFQIDRLVGDQLLGMPLRDGWIKFALGLPVRRI